MKNLMTLAAEIMNPAAPSLLDQAIQDDLDRVYAAAELPGGYTDYADLTYELEQHDAWRADLARQADLAEVYASEIQR